VQWGRVDDFLDSISTDRHYILDVTSGEIQFGNGVKGMIPPPGVGNIMAEYTIGGGKAGNVPTGSINTLKSSIHYIDKVMNPAPAESGADAETIEAVMERGPGLINHRNRAVTLPDFERLAAQASTDIRRTKCYTKNNTVHVIVVPDAPGEQPVISQAGRERIERYLVERCLNTLLPAGIAVDNPEYCGVHSRITAVPHSIEGAVAAQKAVQEALRRYFHPLTGGTLGTGWQFGRTVRISDLYAFLGSVPEVDHIKDLAIGSSPHALADADLTIGEYGLVCSGTHRVDVTMEGWRNGAS
jgi:predicted phage baseplate assembly protein